MASPTSPAASMADISSLPAEPTPPSTCGKSMCRCVREKWHPLSEIVQNTSLNHSSSMSTHSLQTYRMYHLTPLHKLCRDENDYGFWNRSNMVLLPLLLPKMNSFIGISLNSLEAVDRFQISGFEAREQARSFTVHTSSKLQGVS